MQSTRWWDGGFFWCSAFMGFRTARLVSCVEAVGVLFCWVSSGQNKSSRINFPRIGTSYSRDGGMLCFARVVSARCTDGVSFACILLLWGVQTGGGTFHYPPRLLALYAKDSGVIRAIVCCCGAGISLSHFALGSFDGWYPA